MCHFKVCDGSRWGDQAHQRGNFEVDFSGRFGHFYEMPKIVIMGLP
jgi:hypothetical protein